MRQFLSKDEPWTWLVAQTQRTCAGIRTPSADIFDALTKSENFGLGRSRPFNIFVPWQPRKFLLDNYAKDELPNLRDVIVLTSSDQRVYATTCGAYVEQMWPTIGPPILQALDRLLADGTRVAYGKAAFGI